MAKTLTGVVTSDKSDKTIVVTIKTRKTHALYKKQYTVSSKFMAHDEKNEAKIGDTVVIGETRPISKRKKFALQSVILKAGVAFVEPETPQLPEKQKPATKAKVKATDKSEPEPKEDEK